MMTRGCQGGDKEELVEGGELKEDVVEGGELELEEGRGGRGEEDCKEESPDTSM